jgi:hypothetical protein
LLPDPAHDGLFLLFWLRKLTFELRNCSISILHLEVTWNFQHQTFVMRNSMNDEHKNKDQSGGWKGADRRAIVCAFLIAPKAPAAARAMPGWAVQLWPSISARAYSSACHQPLQQQGNDNLLQLQPQHWERRRRRLPN